MNKQRSITSKLALFACLFAFVVIVLGAYTRLTDAGLGCPDWPGCYNHLTVPDTHNAIKQAELAYPGSPVHVVKAWTEMVHRYAAGFLSLLILAIAMIVIRQRRQAHQADDRLPLVIPLVLIGLVVFQAMLGMWTVTMRLQPIVVMGHLLGGFSIITLLWWYNLRSGNYFAKSSLSDVSSNLKAFRPWAILGLIIVAVQVALGGWTSANYAALACPDFPYCTAQGFFPQADFRDAFNLLNPAGQHLSHAALITIQMMHRIGAMITAFYVGALGVCLLFMRKSTFLSKLGVVMLVLLAIQIMLGILNVVWVLPLHVALAHNAMAALLLLTLVTFTFIVFKSAKNSVAVSTHE